MLPLHTHPQTAVDAPTIVDCVSGREIGFDPINREAIYFT
jgi:hypothetical protein